MSMQNLAEKIGACFPVILVQTFEPARVMDALEDITVSQKRYLGRWSRTDGFAITNSDVKEADYPKLGIPAARDMSAPPFPAQCAISMAQHQVPSNQPQVAAVIAALNLNWWLADATIRQWILDAHEKLTGQRVSLVIVSSTADVPPELQKVVQIIEWPLPDQNELGEILSIKTEMATASRATGGLGLGFKQTPQDREALIGALKGLTLDETNSFLDLMLVRYGRLTADTDVLDALGDHKRQVVRQTEMLEYLDADRGMADVGGLDLLKRYVQEVAAVASADAAAFGANPPLGMLLVGPPGTGKTLTSRIVAAIFGRPLIRFNMAAVFSGLVGASESNMRRALRIIEAVAPCVVQIDEIEKGMSVRGGEMDGGTATRVLGQFLTWMQDRMDKGQRDVFVVATANRAMNLDSALIRRFDDVFFVDLPQADERAEIFQIMLSRAGRDPETMGLDLAVLADMTEGYSGAEIEKITRAAVRKAWLETLGGNSVAITQDGLVASVTEVVPVSRTMEADIEAMRDWAIRARPASSNQTIGGNPDALPEIVATKKGYKVVNPDLGADNA